MATSRYTGSSDETVGYDDFWQELQEIQRGKDPDADTGSEDELESKTPDEGEEAADWLHSAGYGEIVDQVLEGKDIEEDVIDIAGSLTRAQRTTIKRRINTLRATIHKKKNRQHGKTDVRDIFSQREGPPSPQPQTPRSSRISLSNDSTSHDLYGPPSPPGQRTSRNLSIYRRREYNMDRDGIPQTEAAVETLSIQSKSVSRPRMSSSGSDDALLSPHSHISLPICDADVNVSLQSAITARSSNSAILRNKSRSPLSSSSGAPASPMSLGSSPLSSPNSHSWRGTSDFLDGLPYIHVQPDTLGVTRINDLSIPDAAKLRPLLLLELTTLFDHYHITYTRRKAKKKYKDTGVFGLPLHLLLEQDQKNFRNSKLTVPLFFQQLIGFLSEEGTPEEGILRVPGSVVRIKSLRQEIDEKFNSRNFVWSNIRPNDAAGLLKLFLRDLPAPMLTYEYIDAFAQVEQITDLQEQIMALKLLVLLLPEVNRNTLQLLLRFLKKVVDHKENLMTMNNVAMIMAPNLFLMQSNRSQNKAIKYSELQMAAGTSNIVRMLIHYQHLLWVVPTTMIQQLRHQNEAEQLRKSRDKSIMKLLGRKDKSDPYKKPQINNESDFNRRVIRVQVPSMTKFNTAIQLEPGVSAGDIVTRCLQDVAGPRPLPKSSSRVLTGIAGKGALNGRLDSSGDELEEDNAVWQSSLYEIGGNIGERRLDNSTKVLEVLRYNPNADWVIRSKSHLL